MSTTPAPAAPAPVDDVAFWAAYRAQQAHRAAQRLSERHQAHRVARCLRLWSERSARGAA